jgi:hypothetical protein
MDLEQGNHSVFDYTRLFNSLAQYGSYHIDTDKKKANLHHEGLTCHTPVLKSTEPKPLYVCPGCLITRIATI